MICRVGLRPIAISANGNGMGPGNESITRLSRQLRVCVGREPEPSAAVIDSQSVKTSAVRGDAREYDAGKKNLGPKTASAGRHAGLGDLRQSVGGRHHGS